MTPNELAAMLRHILKSYFAGSAYITTSDLRHIGDAADLIESQARRIEELEGEWGRHEEAHVVYIDGCRYCESYAEGMRRSVKAQQASEEKR